MDELFNTMAVTDIGGATDELLIINPDTRQIDLPGNELVFGVESDQNGERKYFVCPRYVGNNIDLASCFVRVNYRNANGEVDFDLVDDLTVDGDNVVFSWEVSGKAVAYKGQMKFVVCFTIPGSKPYEWHTTVTTGIVLEGLEPDSEAVEAASADGIAQILALVEAQTAAVETVGAEQVGWVETTGAEQIIAVEQAASDAEAASVAEIEAKGKNTLASIPNDYTALSEAVDVLSRSVAPGIVCEAEGSAITLDDASDNYIQGMRIFGRSTQDGVPTPDAPVEIVSVENPVVTVCGKNLLDMSKVANANLVENNGVWTFTRNENTERFSNLAPIYVPANTPVTVSLEFIEATTSSRNIIWYFVGESKENLYDSTSSCLTKIYSEPIVGIRFYLESSEAVGAYIRFKNLQIEIGSEATTYEPHKAIQTVELTHTLPGIPVPSGGNYTDSDGQQWICDEVDLARCVYVQRIKVKTVNGSLTPTVFVNGNSGGTILGWAYEAIGMDGILRNRTHKMCDKLQAMSSTDPASYKDCPVGCWTFNSAGSIDGFLLMNVGSFESANEATTWLAKNPVTFWYALATPIETPLSETELAAYRSLHTNKPNTTILNDAGAHMAVEYVADTKLYIDKKIAALTA